VSLTPLALTLAGDPELRRFDEPVALYEVR
jgi:hypothetical protein